MPMEEDRQAPHYPAEEHLLQRIRRVPELTGPRVRLRPPNAEDSKNLARILRSDMLLRKRLARNVSLAALALPQDGDEFRHWLRAWCEQQHAVAYAIVGPGDKALGLISLLDVNREENSAMVTYWLTSSAWGKGYGREALAILLQHAVERGLRIFRAKVSRAETAFWGVWSELGAHIKTGKDQDKYECELNVRNPHFDAALARAARAVPAN
ncbi:MAG TPA: GNAT family N-acetyltransferase [Armatimonadota bacterium]|nr:GNAT family N-acetyltransferase [Armatimonadota bacterium]